MSQRQIKGLVSPSIMKADKLACEKIAERIKREKEALELVKGWQERNREELRTRLLNRHNSVQELQRSLGVRRGISRLLGCDSTVSQTWGEKAAPLPDVTGKDSSMGRPKLAATISRLSQPRELSSDNIFVGGDFRGLIHADCAGAYDLNAPDPMRRSMLMGSTTGSFKSAVLSKASCTQNPMGSTWRGFPFPEYAGVAKCEANRPLSKTISVGQSESRMAQREAERRKVIAEKRAEELERRQGELDIQEWKATLQLHRMRFGKQDHKVGYPKMKLTEALNYETGARERLDMMKRRSRLDLNDLA